MTAIDEGPLWKKALEQTRAEQSGMAWDLFDIYLSAAELVREWCAERDWDPTQAWIALVGEYAVDVSAADEKEDVTQLRKFSAVLVKQHGMLALEGWRKAIGSTDEWEPQQWFRYARGVCSRAAAEQIGR